jgi:hypothetical protein
MTLIAIRCSEHFSVGLTTPNWWGEGVGYECMTIVSFVAGYLGLPAGCIYIRTEELHRSMAFQGCAVV